jgi:two-component system cell cycle response regulator DivK
MRILIVEDNPKNLKLFRVIVEAMGHECLTAEDGIAGVATALTEGPDLVFMDIQMPGMDGVTALHRLRERESMRTTPVIALTSYTMKGDRERFLAEGFSDYAGKPVGRAVLTELIRKWTRACEQGERGG